ncbi:MAG: class I tRNA ligase family protein, partial [Candidatus Moranbacteria bacterium]|nr:class I tRNA ligase family protein [Candidatus Moranbacteria bacterium]
MKNSELPKIYSPRETEDKIYQIWEKSGFFNPDNLNLPEDAKTYTIVLPPPNITAKLHLGHSAMLAIEDLLIRFHRMRGYRALWVPGTDHAAIATQNVVEKKIYNETGLTRHDLGKEKFLEKVWEFLKETQSTILYQTRKMGSSLDWSREAFTLDEDRKKAVMRMFVDMYKAGIIYRGERIVNWCPRCQSTLADDEVEHFEQTGKLYTFRYWKDFPISISTTRPETKLGDTAVAVNPRDERYRELIGQEFEGLFCGIKLKIKIIADHEVDMQFGTGALGVTPAHSMVDWKMAEKNNLAIVKVIDEEGRINSQFKKYSGMSASEARELIVSDLRENNLLEKEEEIKNNLSVCYRCDSAIEPLPSKQWFVAVDKPVEKLQNKSLKQKSIELAAEKQIKFIPFRFTKRYLDWMENLHDWCISRQIWFGHDIPAYYCECGEIIISETKPETCPKCHSAKITQDEDSLDTWFSSGMWTFSTLGWPDNFKNNRKS